MEKNQIRQSDMSVSRIAMGGCPMGRYGWGEVQTKELIETVHLALDSGINFFDTADTYGLGESERILGEALQGHRADSFIATKFGVRVENGKTFYDNSPEYIEKAITGSLQRLKTDYVDLYQIHYRDNVTPLSAVVDKLEQLKQRGLIRSYGLSNITEQDIEEILPYQDRFVSFQNEYSLACRTSEKMLLELSQKYRWTPLTWGSLGQGILTGKYTKENVSFQSDDRRSRDVYVNFHAKLEHNLAIVDVMKTIAQEHHRSVSAVAIRWILDRLPGSIALVGMKRPSQCLGNLEADGWHLTDQDIQKLDEVSKDKGEVHEN